MLTDKGQVRTARNSTWTNAIDIGTWNAVRALCKPVVSHPTSLDDVASTVCAWVVRTGLTTPAIA